MACLAKLGPLKADILKSLDSLDNQFERDLTRERKSDDSHMNENTILILMRLSGYQMKAEELLEFTEGRMFNAFVMIDSLLNSAVHYEEAVTLCCFKLLVQLTQPATLFKQEGGDAATDADVSEYAVKEFSDKIDFIANFAMR